MLRVFSYASKVGVKGDRGESGDRAVRSCSNSERDGRNDALERLDDDDDDDTKVVDNIIATDLDVSVTNPSSEWSDGVDMDFLSDSVPGSRGGLVGQGVSGT